MVMLFKNTEAGYLEWGQGAIKSHFDSLSPEAAKRLNGRSLIIQEYEADLFSVRDSTLVYEE